MKASNIFFQTEQIILFILIFINISPGHAQDNDWIFHATTAMGTQVNGLDENTIAKDNFGNYFVTSSVVDPTEFGNFTIHGFELAPDFYSFGTYLSKFNSEGIPQWIKTFGGTGILIIQDAVTDDEGNIYIVGGTQGSVNFEGTTIDGQEMLLAKFNTDGELQWLSVSNSQSGFGTEASGSSIAIGPNDNLIISGYINNEVHFESIVLDADESHFLASYDADGFINWARSYGQHFSLGGNLQNISEIVIDDSNNIYLTGMTKGDNASGIVVFDNISFESDFSMFVAKFDDIGNVIWLNHYDAPPDSFANATATNIALDKNDNSLIIAGNFNDTITFGNTMLSTPGFSTDYLFLTKYDEDGAVVWAKQGSGTATRPLVFDMDTNDQGEIFVVFTMRTDISGADQFTIGEGVNAQSFFIGHQHKGFLAKFKTNGDLDWVKDTKGFEDNWINAVQAVGDNSAIISGYFTDEMQLGSTTLNSTPSESTANYFLTLCNGDLSNGIFKPTLNTLDNSFELYPNPAEEEVLVDFSKNNFIDQLFFLTAEGVVVKKIVNPETKENISLENLSPGIYFFQALTKSGIESKKLIVH